MNSPIKNNAVEQFFTLLQKGYEMWMQAGKVVADALESDVDFAEKVNKAHPEVSVDVVYAFDRIGRKQLHPKLAISDSPGAKKLRRLPYAQQEKFINQPLPVLIKQVNGWEVLKVSVFNLTAEQSSQVFDGDVVRTEAEQRAYLETKSSKSLIQIDEPYRVSGRKLIVMQACQFTAGQLARLLAEMEN